MAAILASFLGCSWLPAVVTLMGALQQSGAEQPLLRTFRAAEGAAKIGGEGVPSGPRGGPRVVVRLQRESVRSVGGGLLGGLSEDAGFYVGKVSVGSPPQVFSVLFDTASGQVVLPSTKCQNTTCLERSRFSPSASTTAQMINVNGNPVLAGDKVKDDLNVGFAQIDIGEGDVWGDGFHDRVCLGVAANEGACAGLGFVAARSMDEVPFRSLPYDGMVGLGLDGLLFASPLFSFFRSLAAASPDMHPGFSFALRGPTGELAFGGPEPSRQVRWFPVTRPEDGYWQVRIQAVHVDNVTIDTCASGCRGVVDTGASRLGVPAPLAPRLAAALVAAPTAGTGCQGPDLHLDLGGGDFLTLKAQDYAGPSCGAARLTPFQLDPPEMFGGLFVLGESVLRRYDTFFDWSLRRVGFSLVAPRAVRLGPPVPGAVSGQPASLVDAGDLFRVIQV